MSTPSPTVSHYWAPQSPISCPLTASFPSLPKDLPVHPFPTSCSMLHCGEGALHAETSAHLPPLMLQQNYPLLSKPGHALGSAHVWDQAAPDLEGPALAAKIFHIGISSNAGILKWNRKCHHLTIFKITKPVVPNQVRMIKCGVDLHHKFCVNQWGSSGNVLSSEARKAYRSHAIHLACAPMCPFLQFENPWVKVIPRIRKYSVDVYFMLLIFLKSLWLKITAEINCIAASHECREL